MRDFSECVIVIVIVIAISPFTGNNFEHIEVGPLPQIHEQVVKAVKIRPQKAVHHTEDQIMEVAVPQSQEEIVAVEQFIPQEPLMNQTKEQGAAVATDIGRHSKSQEARQIKTIVAQDIPQARAHGCQDGTLTACHHSAQKKLAATHAATQTTVTYGEQALVTEYVTPELAEHHTVVNYAAPVSVPEYVAPASALTFSALAPVIKDVIPARAVTFHPVIEYVAPAPAVFQAAPAPEVEHVALTPAVTFSAPSSAAPAPAVTCSTPDPETDYVTHPPVMEYIAPAPPVVFDMPSQMLPFAHVMAAVTTGVGLDTASVVFEPLRKKQCTENDFSQLVAELDASSRAMEQAVADL